MIVGAIKLPDRRGRWDYFGMLKTAPASMGRITKRSFRSHWEAEFYAMRVAVRYANLRKLCCYV